MQARRIDIGKDRDILLEFHCRINYDSETPYARDVAYERYRDRWLHTSQPDAFLSHLAETMQDERTIAEILEDDGVAVGYLWVTFHDVPDYGLTIGEVMDIAVAPEYQRQGIGRQMLRRAEVVARKHGSTLLRSDTGIENVASQRLHESLDFQPHRLSYEKVLRHNKPIRWESAEPFVRPLAQARSLLQQHGYECDVAVEELRTYAETDTFYPSATTWDEILQDRLVTLHEVIEIAELKRMGLEITRDVVVRNVDEVYEAHLKAAEIEMEIAEALADYQHIQDRLSVFASWTQDPLVPPGLFERYEKLHARARRILAGRRGEES